MSLKAGDVRILLGRDDGAKGLERVKGEGFSLQLTTRPRSASATSKGTIRFAFDKPLPATLVRKFVKTRIAENAAKFHQSPSSDTDL